MSQRHLDAWPDSITCSWPSASSISPVMATKVRKLAQRVRREAGFGPQRVIHVGATAKHLGAEIRMVLTPFAGYLRREGDGWVCVVASWLERDVASMRMVAAHELGHWCFRMLEPRLVDEFATPMEEEAGAHAFANELLLPATLARRAHHELDGDTAEAARQTYSLIDLVEKRWRSMRLRPAQVESQAAAE